MSQRFSDAELAAEYWMARTLQERYGGDLNSLTERDGPKLADRLFKLAEKYAKRAEILHRFATLPHAHEPNLVNESTKEKP